MSHVFISYVRDDTKTVDRLARGLRSLGIRVWLDRDAIKPGSRWADAIRAAIREGTFFVACFSRGYVERSRTYMNEELVIAIDELRLRPVDQSWFIPVLLDETEIPDRSIGAGETLRSLQWVTLYENWDDGVQKLLSVVQPDSAPVNELIQAMSEKSARRKIQAIDNLADLGSLASAAVPALTAALDDENETVRAAAAQALGRLGADSSDVVAKLLAVMRKGDYYDSKHAAKALANLGDAGIPALLQAATFQGYGVASHASGAIAGIGSQAIPALLSVSRMSSRYGPVALNALSNISDPAAIPELIEALHDEDARIRRAAASAIGLVASFHRNALQDFAPAAVSALNATIRDEDPSVRVKVIQTLGRFGELASESVPSLIEAMNNAEMRNDAAHTLGEIGPSARSAWSTLVAWIGDPGARKSIIYALGRTGPAEHVLPVIKNALMDEETRGTAANALGDLGPAAEGAIDALIPLLGDPGEHVRWAAAVALGRIGPAAVSALPVLIHLMQEADWPLQIRVAKALGSIGDRRATHILIEALKTGKKDTVRYDAAGALGELGDPAAIPHLIEMLGHRDSFSQYPARDALINIASKSGNRAVAAALVDAITHNSDKGIQDRTIAVLVKLGGPEAAEELEAAISDDDSEVRSRALAALRDLHRSSR